MTLNLAEVYIERCDKDSEEVIAQEQASFLSTSLTHLKQHMNEFIFIESKDFEPIKTDSLSIEVDDVFKTYMVLLGFKVQKKHAAIIKSYFEENLHGENIYTSMMFSGEDGLWDINIPIDNMNGFREDMTLREAISIIYSFLVQLISTIEQQ
ncbi:branched-chain amino acid aminotransferase [Ureibacillus sp. GCM10028918]|uniref:branched-chain amino acid aminotransferase n=1 Tax=Ureibacillus sp. GCM10028918 TaxID=3273429 RepID=UPI0036127DC0